MMLGQETPLLQRGGSGSGSGSAAVNLASPSKPSAGNSGFTHNARTAIALAPCALILVEMGGVAVMAVLTVGLMIAYILDSLNLKQASFFSLWTTLALSELAFIFTTTLHSSLQSWPLFLLAVAVCAETTFLIGVWASLQFRWLQLENPSICQTLERVLFACTPISATVLWTFAVVAASGMDHAPYFMMGIQCLFYWLFAMPRVSSFRTGPRHNRRYGGQIDDESLILGPLEGALHTLCLMFLPVLFHIGSHHSVLFASIANVCDLLLLFFMPLLFQLYASSFGALWYVSKDPDQLKQIRIVNGAIALMVVCLCLEIRVVFRSFARYVHLSPPWNYLTVSLTMLGGAAASGAYAVGLVGNAVGSAIFTAVSIAVALAGSIVVGVPVLLWPAALAAGYNISQFFIKKTVASYFIFVVAASLPVTWFVVHNYWSLNIWLAGMALKTFCKYIISTIVLAMMIPGLALLPLKTRLLTECGLISHALLVCYIENRLHVYASLYYFYYEDEVIYPSYMVIATTVLGLTLVRRLSLDNRIGTKTVWVLTSLYTAKLSILFLASKTVLWVSVILLLAVSPPLLLYKEKGKIASGMKPWQAVAHASVIAFSVWLCRETIFEGLQWWQGRPPSDGLLLGFIIMVSGVACIPIISIHFPHNQLAKRHLLLVVATGVMFIFLQPPLPEAWSFQSKFTRMSQQFLDDSAIYGLVEKKPVWPSWLLIVAVIVSLAAFTKIIPLQYVVELRFLYSVVVGVTIGIYICAEFFIQSSILHFMLVGVTVCASIFLVFTHLPSTSSPKILPWVFALLVALLPVMYLMEGQLRLTSETEGEEERFIALLALEGARISLLGLFAAIFMLIALEVKIELQSIMKEKALEKSRVHTLSNQNSGFVPKYRLLQQRRVGAASSFTVKKLAAEGAWMPAVGNVATVLCFVICLILNIHLTGGSDRAIFMMAPILLLLNQDSNVFTGFGDRQRYFPLTVVISLYLVTAALYRIWDQVWHGNSSWGLGSNGPSWFFAVRNAALLMLTLPNHVLFNRFMWDYARQPDFILLIIMPLNLPSVVMTDIVTIRVLALLGIMYTLVQYLVSRHIRIKGMKFI